MAGKSVAHARGRGRGPGKSHPSDGERRHGWDFAKALARARQRIAAAADLDPSQYADQTQAPVDRARKRAETAAPALVDFCQALTLGTDPAELDRLRGGLRIAAELALRQLAAVGIKTGETMEHDVSDKFRNFIAGWFSRGGDERRPDDQRPDDTRRRGRTDS